MSHKFSAIVKKRNDDKLEISEICFCSTIATPDTNQLFCLILGLPNSITLSDLQIFLEPYISEITNFYLFFDIFCRRNYALIKFSNIESCQSFTNLYNNLHFPAEEVLPPCLVVQLALVDITSECDGVEPIRSFNYDTKNIILKNTVDNNRFLPTCCICLRRLKFQTSLIHGVDDIPVSTSYTGNGKYCGVCQAYSDSINFELIKSQNLLHRSTIQNTEGSIISCESNIQLRSCDTCGLIKNIWVCMLSSCAHAGCGRYTSQHAKNHYEITCHSFAMELATGRIWDYDYDTFVHVESVSSTLRPMNPFDEENNEQSLSRTTSDNLSLTVNMSNQFIPIEPLIGSQSDTHTSIISSYSQQQFETHSERNHKILKPENIMKYNKELISNSFLLNQDPIVSDKLGCVINEYDKLLENQFKEQSLYFEKKLARETIAALENSLLDYDQTRQSNTKTMIQSENDDYFTDDDLTILMNKKLEISSLEYELSQTLQLINTMETDIRTQRNHNEKLLKLQKQLRSTYDNYNKQYEDYEIQCTNEINECEQQIRDLSFYTKTRSQIEASPLKEEVEGGDLFITSNPHNHSQSKNKKKSNKKK